MAQSGILELAKRGDARAIGALLDRSLAPKGIRAQASLDGNILAVELTSAQIPNQKAIVAVIQRGMESLHVATIARVHVRARRIDSGAILWSSEFGLHDDIDFPADTLTGGEVPVDLAAPTNSSSPPTDDSIAPSGMAGNRGGIPDESPTSPTVKAQQSLARIDRPSQLARELRESQDVVVRFLDPYSGSVRCLTTLAELVRALDKSSFSFANVAANPTLRSLLDTIAEFTIAAPNGDQIVTNVSLLQPGQQWQNVRIRLVSKIYFEPEEEGMAAEDDLSPIVTVATVDPESPDVPLPHTTHTSAPPSAPAPLSVAAEFEPVAARVSHEAAAATLEEFGAAVERDLQVASASPTGSESEPDDRGDRGDLDLDLTERLSEREIDRSLLEDLAALIGDDTELPPPSPPDSSPADTVDTFLDDLLGLGNDLPTPAAAATEPEPREARNVTVEDLSEVFSSF